MGFLVINCIVAEWVLKSQRYELLTNLALAWSSLLLSSSHRHIGITSFAAITINNSGFQRLLPWLWNYFRAFLWRIGTGMIFIMSELSDWNIYRGEFMETQHRIEITNLWKFKLNQSSESVVEPPPLTCFHFFFIHQVLFYSFVKIYSILGKHISGNISHHDHTP